MPIPTPHTNEDKSQFMGRCMSDPVMTSEHPTTEQRTAVCLSSWERPHKIQSNIKALARLHRTEKKHGKEYLVLPSVLLTEGVHNGFYYPPSELAKHPSAWSGRPIPIQHPLSDGNPVTCNSPDLLLGDGSVGYTFNTRYEDGKLKGELWIDKQKISKVDPHTFRHLQAGLPIEISTGLWSDEEESPGVWNGEEYTAVIKGMKPDHVAILPGAVGACSWADGCGAPRINEDSTQPKTDDTEVSMNDSEDFVSVWQKFKSFFRSNEKSHDQLRESLRGLVKHTENQVVNVIDVFDKYFVYAVLDVPPAEIIPMTSGDRVLYRQDYKVDGKDKVTLEGSPKQVDLVTDYVVANEEVAEEAREQTTINEGSAEEGVVTQDSPPTNNEDGQGDVVEETTTTEQTNNPKQNDGGGNMSKLIDQLIANARSRFTEDDREWLGTLSDCQLTKLMPEEAPKANTEDEQLTLSQVLASKEFAQAIVTTVKALVAKEKKSDMVKEAAALKEQLGLTDEELEAMPQSVLAKMLKTNSGDFSGRGAPVDTQDDGNGVPEPPKVLSARKEDK